MDITELKLCKIMESSGTITNLTISIIVAALQTRISSALRFTLHHGMQFLIFIRFDFLFQYIYIYSNKLIHESIYIKVQNVGKNSTSLTDLKSITYFKCKRIGSTPIASSKHSYKHINKSTIGHFAYLLNNIQI